MSDTEDTLNAQEQSAVEQVRDETGLLLDDLEAGWLAARRYYATPAERERDCDGVVIQRDDLREKLDRIRAAAESDPDLPAALKSFLLRETEPGWLHVTDAMVGRLRATGTHHERRP